MISDLIKKKKKNTIKKFAIYLVVIGIVLLIIGIIFPSCVKKELIAFFGITVLFGIIIVVTVNRGNEKLYKMNFKVVTLVHKVPFPISFIKKGRTLLVDGNKGYTIGKMIIPARFVEFTEGSRAYIVKKLSKVHQTNKYKILFIHQQKYALIEDVDQQKWLIHLNCLEQLTSK